MEWLQRRIVKGMDMKNMQQVVEYHILKAFGKAMAEIRFQQFQHNALQAAVNNMVNTLY